MEVSVIIPSYNGQLKLPSTLNSLREQSFQDFQLIVVLDGSTDESLRLVQAYNDHFKDLKIIEQSNCGRACARNRGSAEADGNIIIFIDDDIELRSDNIETHYKFIKDNKDRILFGMANLNPEKIQDDSFLMYRHRVEHSVDLSSSSMQFQPVRAENYMITTQNISISKNAFNTLGMFDERLTDSEDFEFGIRALKAGMKIFYATHLQSFHNDFPDIKKFIKRQHQYYLSKLNVLKLYPDYRQFVPEQFLWSALSWKDKPKRWVFRDSKRWFDFCNSSTFRLIPTGLQNYIFDMLIYTQSVIPVKDLIADE